MVPAPVLVMLRPPEASVMAALTSRSVAAAPSATLKVMPGAPPSARMRMRPPMVAVSALALVVTLELIHSNCGPFALLTPLLLCKVPPVILTPPVICQTCITPGDVTVPPLMSNVVTIDPPCQPRPVPSPSTETVPPAFTVSTFRRRL